MRNRMGSGLVDYILPTALVGLVVGLGVYNLSSGGGLTKFLTASGNMKAGTSDGEAIVTSFGEKEGASGFDTAAEKANSTDTSTPDDASLNLNSVNCSSGSCDLDFGSFTLNGIPENFAEVVETAGTSGGTEKLLALIDQIVEAAENEGIDNDLIKQLSTYGHELASTQKSVEDIANNFTSEQNTIDTFTSELSVMSNELSKIDTSSIQDTLAQITYNLSTTTSPNELAIMQIANALGTEILSLNNNFVTGCTDSINNAENEIKTYETDVAYDEYGVNIYSSNTAISYIKNTVNSPDTSNVTNIKSKIICKTGNGEDTGTKCN